MLGLVFYETERGNSPVEDYLAGQEDATKALLWEKIEAFCEEFPNVQTVSIKHLRSKIWEIRVADARGKQHRLLYAVIGSDLVLLHAFLKKVQKTPPDDLALAERRIRQMTS